MEDVPFQIGLVMVSVMMKITMKNAIMMVVTAVVPMSIQKGAQFVNASVMEDQVEEMGVLQPQLLL